MIPLADGTKRRLGLFMVGMTELFVATSFVLYVFAGEATAAVEVFVLGTAFGAVLVFTVRAQPQNGAVWALLWAAVIGVGSDLGSSIAIHRDDVTGQQILDGTVRSSPSELDLIASIGLTAELVLWLPAIYLLSIHALILFPGGQAPTDRWRVVAFITAGLMALQTVVGIVRIGPWQSTPYDELVDDTFGIFGPLALLQALLQLAAVAALINLLRRYRRSSGEERLQFRWVVWALALFVGNFFLYWMWERFGVAQLASTIVLVNIGVAFAIAIAKYRLYNIDLIVSKSVMYLGLVTAVTAVYAAVVVLPLVVIDALDTGEGPGLMLPVVATGVVALLFEPIRSRMERWANRFVYGDRTTPHAVLSSVTSRFSNAEGQSTDDLARLVAEGTGAEQAVVWLDGGTELRVVGSWPFDVPPRVSTPDDQHHQLVEVRHEAERLGALSVTKPRNDPITPADRELLEDVAAGVGLTLRNIRLNRELEDRANEVRDSRRRLVAAQDRERRRLERDLHDGAQQQVVALKVKLGIAKTVAQREGADAIAEGVVALANDTQDAVDALRRVAHGIYPPLLESEGLERALRAVERTSHLPIDLNVSDLERYGRATEETVYFCVTETLERARMSGATTAQVGLVGQNGDLIARIDLDASVAELDLTSVADRLDAAGGALVIDHGSDGRSHIVGSLPVHTTKEAPA